MKPYGIGAFQAGHREIKRLRAFRGEVHEQGERDRIATEAGRRFATLTPQAWEGTRPLSRVEKVMRKNAPDLAGGSPEEVAIACARRRAHHYAKWPRPRLSALIVLMVLAVVNPLPLLQVAVWGVALFLVLSVIVGPEHARDYSKALWLRFVGLWKHEIIIARKVGLCLHHQINIWLRTSL